MKKKINVLILTTILIISAIAFSGCSDQQKITVEYDKSISLELISADSELGDVTVNDNKVELLSPEKDGDYEIKVKTTDNKEITINLVFDENGCTVSDDSGLSLKAISE